MLITAIVVHVVQKSKSYQLLTYIISIDITTGTLKHLFKIIC